MISALGITSVRILRTAYAAMFALCLNGTVLIIHSHTLLYSMIGQGGIRAIETLVSIYLSALLLRIFARTFPLRADLKLRYGSIGVLSVVALISFALLATNIMFDEPDYKHTVPTSMSLKGVTPEQAEVLSHIVVTAWTFAAHTMMEAAIQVLTYFWFLGLLIPLLGILHIHLFRRYPSKTILFLRRFGGSADAALMSALMQIVPRGTKVALIASPGSMATSWDPLVLIFSGFRWTRPWSNLPLYLESSDSCWKANVFRWISNSDLVVFCSSNLSDSMSTEWKLIQKAGAASRTILMNESLTTHTFPDSHNSSATEINYQLSWNTAARRIIVGAGILTITAYLASEFVGVEVATILGLLTLLPMAHRSLSSSSLRKLQMVVHEKLSA